ncbi:hypothetical protein MUB04_15930 [Acinetobacter indicus]|uniref:hypothetical protein n=1 Tax=Acinetobacter TaxID=469 RepID=UPI0015D3CED6|nr:MULTISPECIES: hypothetical protein [Acinetobacter]MCP0918028.1 hypothetical protein [Acinetobacter indicus]
MNTQQQSPCLVDFHIVYYKSGSKETITSRLPKESGYEIMRKRAAAMAPGLMAQAVHPEDVKALILNTQSL